MLPAKALFSIGAMVIAGTFVGLMVKSRGPTDREIESNDALEKFGEEQTKLAAGEACHDAVGHAVSIAGDYLTSRYGDGAPDGVRELAVHRCTTDGWSPDVVKCLDRVTSDSDMQRCIGQLAEFQRRALEAEMKAFSQKPPRAVDAGIDAPSTYDDYYSDPDNGNPLGIWADAAVGDPMGTPAACLEYQQLMEKFALCDKLPQASRDAMRQAFESVKDSWGKMGSMPQTARDAMDSACKQGAEALRQSGASLCGW